MFEEFVSGISTRCNNNIITVRITQLYAHIENTPFYFLIKVIWGVDSKSEIHFFGRHWETPITQKKKKKKKKSGLSRLSGVGR